MFERIIVPLDGSPSAEAALPAAEELARRLGSSLVLLHVLEARAPTSVHGERHLASPAEAEAYLATIASRLAAQGLSASAHIHLHEGGSRDVAGEVAAHEAEFGNDLVVMVRHGKRSLSDLVSGSLPLKVAASGGASVLLVPAEAGAKFAPVRVLVPLDGRKEHEIAIPPAHLLARTFGLELEYITVVPRRGSEAGGAGFALSRLSPALSGASLEYAADESRKYLEDLAQRAKAEGLRASWSLERGRPAKALLSCVESEDLVVLSTHRQLGLDASLDGRVAFGVARGCRSAMLIVPVPRE